MSHCLGFKNEQNTLSYLIDSTDPL